jgi:hypothetical protein
MKLRLTQKELVNQGGDGGLEISIESCVGDPQEKSPGTAVFIEKYDGKIQVHVWDGNEQDCKTFILKQYKQRRPQ